MRHIRFTIGLLALALAAAVSAAPASASGVTESQLKNAHWECIITPLSPDTHCVPKGGLDAVFTGTAKAMPVMVFEGDNGPFLGTEILIRGDVFGESRRPCPAELPSREYTHLGVLGLDYYTCHHYDTEEF